MLTENYFISGIFSGCKNLKHVELLLGGNSLNASALKSITDSIKNIENVVLDISYNPVKSEAILYFLREITYTQSLSLYLT